MNKAGIVQRFRRWQLAREGLRLDRSCRVGAAVSLGPAPVRSGAVVVGSECELGNGVELNPWMGRITIGRRVFIGPYVVIYGHGGVEVGDNSLIAMHSCILSSNHQLSDRALVLRNQPDVLLPTRIGRDCWLGAGVRVLGGVTIGEGCIVGAGSVVTKDLPPFSICVGVPARIIGERK